MKKLLVLFLSLVAVFALASCDKHKHKYGKGWEHDATNHWHECECGEKDGLAAHTGGTATETKKATCKVCGQPYGSVLGGEDEETETDEVTETETETEDSQTTPEVVKYTITYVVNGHGTAPSAEEGTSLPTTLPELTAEGWVFEGWYTDEALTTAATAGAEITANTTLYAKWSEKVATYTIAFNNNGHGKETPASLEEVVAMPETLPTPTAASYTFEGWYLEAACTTAVTAGTIISANLTLYAKWTLNVDLSAVSLVDKEVEFDGARHSLEITGTLPEGLKVSYEGNNQMTKGDYAITATITDADGEVLKTLEATLKIVANKTDAINYPYLKSIGIDPSETHTAYQLLVYSFYDSNNDGYGDLKGVEMKLDYIKELGTDMIWLSPVMTAGSYHGYDVLSFYSIDPKLGTMADFKSLVNKAHEKGIKIILDMPINHTSNEHEWFQAYLNDEEGYTEYYQTYDPSVTYGQGGYGQFEVDETTGKKYFAAFGETMPDLNYQSEELKQGVQDVFEYWVELGADGFRLDAIKHIYDPHEIPSYQNSVELNNQYFSELRSYLKGINPNIYLVGENFSGQGEVKQYATSFDAEFDFDSWQTALGAVAGIGPWGGGEEKKIYFDDTVVGNTNELLSMNPEWIPSYMTGNHDVNRATSWIADRVADDAAALKLYAAMVTLRAGIPYIYYGDEIGMYGVNKHGTWVGDAELRLPMTFSDSTVDVRSIFTNTYEDPTTGAVSYVGDNIYLDWPTFETDNPKVETELANSDSLVNTYKKLIQLRNEIPAISLGSMSSVSDYNSVATIIGFTYNGETTYVAFNFSDKATTLSNICDGTITLIDTINGATVNGTTLNMSARGVAIFTTTGTMATKFSGFTLRGSMSNWEPSEEYEFVPHNASEVKLENVELEAGAKFKVVQDNAASHTSADTPVWWHGYDQVKQDCRYLTSDTDGDKNIIIKEAGTYSFYWDVDNFQLWIEKVQ